VILHVEVAGVGMAEVEVAPCDTQILCCILLRTKLSTEKETSLDASGEWLLYMRSFISGVAKVLEKRATGGPAACQAVHFHRYRGLAAPCLTTYKDEQGGMRGIIGGIFASTEENISQRCRQCCSRDGIER